MNFYIIKHDQCGRPLPFIKTFSGEETIPNHLIQGIDYDFFPSTYGVKLTEYDIDNYKAHFSIWQHFLQFPTYDICMIMEEGVKVNSTVEDIQSSFSDMHGDWDVFFPYDKVSEESRGTVVELSASRFGFFWGSYCYFMQKNGARKMIQSDIISQPVDEELLKNSLSDQIKTVFSKTDWIEYNESESRSYLLRHMSIKDAIFNHQAWTKNTKQDAIAIMDYLSCVAEDMGIDLFLHAGTLLGSVRHGGIMPWDDDIDLMMDVNDFAKFTQEIKRQGVAKYCPWGWASTNQEYYKFWFETGEATEGFPYRYPFIDIWVFHKNKNGLLDTCDGYRFEHKSYFPARPTLFEGCSLKIPHDYNEILDICYQDWRTHIRVYTWSHRFKTSMFKPLSLAIQVDDNGRYIEVL